MSVDAPGALDVVEVATPEDLAERAPAWDELAARSGRHGTLNATYPWFASFAEHRLAEFGTSWGCLFAYDADELVGVLPFVHSPHALLRGARPWLRVPGDRHTTGGGMLVTTPAVARALARAALALRPRPVGLRLGGLVPSAHALAAMADEPGALVADEELAGRSIVLDGTWEAFHASLGSNFRRNLRKAGNRLRKQGTLEVETSDDPAALDRYLALESSGWKSDSGGTVAQRPPALAFYRAFCRRLAERGWLQWHFLTLDGVAIAGSLAVRWGRQIVLQRVAYDQAHARTSPGQVLLAAALERWFAEESWKRVDCLTDQPWHATWHMERTPYASLALTAPGLVGNVAGRLPARTRAALKGFGPLRRLVRRMRGEEPR